MSGTDPGFRKSVVKLAEHESAPGGVITFRFSDSATSLFDLEIDGVHPHQVAIAAYYLGEQAKLMIGSEIIQLAQRAMASAGIVVPTSPLPGQGRRDPGQGPLPLRRPKG